MLKNLCDRYFEGNNSIVLRNDTTNNPKKNTVYVKSCFYASTQMPNKANKTVLKATKSKKRERKTALDAHSFHLEAPTLAETTKDLEVLNGMEEKLRRKSSECTIIK